MKKKQDMENKIFKYTMPVKEIVELELPKGYTIIRTQDIEGEFFIWAIVDTEEKETEKLVLELYKTGQEFKSPLEDLEFIGFCRLFIMQELGLYVFKNIKKSC